MIKGDIIVNLNSEYIDELNQVLESSAKQEVNDINLICCRNDPVYNVLNRYSTSSYDHCMVTDYFSINPEDRVKVDITCL